MFWITGGHTIDLFIKGSVPLTSREPTTPFWNFASTYLEFCHTFWILAPIESPESQVPS